MRSGKTWPHIFRFSVPLLILLSILPISSPGTIPDQQAYAAANVVPMPIISRGLPAYTNDDCGGSYPATNANDASYDTQWGSCNSQPSAMNPKWLAYDLSSVPAAQRGSVIVAWYNNCCSYNNTISGTGAYNL